MIKKDSMILGMICGILSPLLGIILYWLLQFHEMKLSEFISHILTYKLISPTLSLALLLNLGVFFLFLRKEYYLSSRGVLFATFTYAGIILLAKVGVI